VRDRAALLLLIGFGAAVPAAAQPVVTSPAPDKLEVTVYRDPDRGERAMNLQWLNGFALISERRRVRLPAGESVVRFEGVAGGIVPQSAIVTGFPDGIVERNRDAYLLSPGTLLDRSLGRRVHLRRTSSATGEVREQEAVVRSSLAGAVVLETEEGIEALRCTGIPETIVYDEVPAGLSAKPTLSVRTRAASPIEAVVTLSYLATGFDWQANYIGELADDERTLDLFAWLTLGSQDQTSFPDADTQAVAGRLNYTRAPVPPVESAPLELRCWPSATTSDVPLEELERREREYDDIIVTGSRIQRRALEAPSPMSVISAEEVMTAVQENLGDLKLYRIPEPVTVAANSQKQVALMVRENVRVQSLFRARIGSVQDGETAAARRFLVTRNRSQEGLGLPLPQGGVALFTNRRGQPFLSGSGRVEDRAIGEDVEIDFGPAPGVTFRRDQAGSGPGWADYVVVVSTDRPRPVRVEVEIPVPDNTRIENTSARLGERDGLRIWTVTVPANGSATFRYRVQTLG
jgi:hypothetical protein